MRIQHNIMAMNAYRNYMGNTSALSKNLEKLSSGYKINRAGDDAAGLAISEKMRAQITGLDAAQKNVKDGISLVKTAEGAMQEIHDMLNRMTYLATQSANGTYDDPVDRANLQKEIQSLSSEIDRIADSANFNGIKLMDGQLGLDTDVFSISGVDAVEAGEVSGVFGTVPAEGAKGTGTILHEEGTDGQGGSFTIDLSQLKVTVTDQTTDKAVYSITIGDVKFDITANTAGDQNAQTIASDLVTNHIKDGLAVNSSGTVVKADDAKTDKGALLYSATNNNDGTITFEAKQYSDGTGWKDLADTTDFIPAATEVAEKALVDPHFEVKAEQGTIGILTGAENVRATEITAPATEKADTFANTVVAFDVTKLKDGMTLTIAGEAYTIGIGKNGTQGAKIDLTDFEESELEANKAAVLHAITVGTAANNTFSVGTDGNGNLTFAEKTNGAGTTNVADTDLLKKLGSVDGIQSLLSVSVADSSDAGTKVSNIGTIKDGNTLTVDGTQYVFTKDADKVASGSTDTTKYIDLNGGMTALDTALQGAGYTTELSGSDLTIYGKANSEGEVFAPNVLGKGLTLQIGDTSDDYNKLSVAISDMHTDALGIGDIDISTQEGAAAAVDKIKDAINSVSSTRGDLGAIQNRLEHTANNLSVMEENIQDAESTIRDTDIAEEMMAYTKNNILIQSAQAMLAQANQVPQGVLQLLQ